MKDCTKSTKRDFKPDLYILYVGTNDLSLDDTPEVISYRKCRHYQISDDRKKQIIISNIAPRGDEYKEKGEMLKNVIHDVVMRKIFQ